MTHSLLWHGHIDVSVPQEPHLNARLSCLVTAATDTSLLNSDSTQIVSRQAVSDSHSMRQTITCDFVLIGPLLCQRV